MRAGPALAVRCSARLEAGPGLIERCSGWLVCRVVPGERPAAGRGCGGAWSLRLGARVWGLGPGV